MTSGITNLPYNGDIPFSTATPFTYREGSTLLQMMYEFKLWASKFGPDLEKQLNDALAAFAEELGNTKTGWQELFDRFMADVVAQLEGLNDQAVANLIPNESTATGAAIAQEFYKHHAPEFFVDVAEFGAKQDGTDASAAFIAANAEAAAKGKTLVASGKYTIKNKVLITADCNFIGSEITADLEGVAIEVTSVRRKHIFGDIINGRKLPGGWDNVTNSKGLVMRNCNTSYVEYQFIRNFEHGLTLYGDNGGCAYNTIMCGALWHNKVNLVLETTTNTGTGYSNQNTFIGGRWQHESNDSGVNAPGVKQVWFRGGISPDDGGRSNNNTFIGSSFEGAAPEYTVDFERASQNVLLNCRYEFGNKIRFGSVSRDNNMLGGFGLAEIVKVTEPGATRNRWEAGNEAVRYQVVESLYGASDAAFPYFQMNWARRSMALGVGSAAPREIRASSSAALSVDASWFPESSGVYDNGHPNNRWRNQFANVINLDDRIVLTPRTGHPPVTTGGASVYLLKNPSGTHRLMCQLPDGTTHMLAGSAT